MKTMYIRKGRKIKNIEDNTTEVFDHINEAKRESRRLQMANGGLGRGSVVVEQK